MNQETTKLQSQLVTEFEIAHLISRSDRDHQVSLIFSPQGIFLEAIPENQWAFDELAKLQGSIQ